MEKVEEKVVEMPERPRRFSDRIKEETNYQRRFKSKAVRGKVALKRPHDQMWFRAHPTFQIDARCIRNRDQREKIHPIPPDCEEVLEALYQFTQPVRFFAAITFHNSLIVIPCFLEDILGRSNPFYETLLEAVVASRNNWVRLRSAEDSSDGYDYDIAEEAIGDPDWSDVDLDETLEKALEHLLIENLEHPIAKTLLGKLWD